VYCGLATLVTVTHHSHRQRLPRRIQVLQNIIRNGTPNQLFDSGLMSVEVGDESISNIMERRVITIHSDAPVDDIMSSCVERRLSDLVVVDRENRFLGMITAFEILSYINPVMGIHDGRKTMGHSLVVGQCPKAGDLMTDIHLTVSENTSIGKALKDMKRDHHRYLVVLDSGRRVIGMVNLCDILSYLVGKGIIPKSNVCDP
jgi:predicted transcriptional regulator